MNNRKKHTVFFAATFAISIFLAGCIKTESEKEQSFFEKNDTPFQVAGIKIGMTDSQVEKNGLDSTDCREAGLGLEKVWTCKLLNKSQKVKFFGVEIRSGTIEYSNAYTNLAKLHFFSENGTILQKTVQESWGITDSCIDGATLDALLESANFNNSRLISELYSLEIVPHSDEGFACLSKKGELLLVNSYKTSGKKEEFSSITLLQLKKEWMKTYEMVITLSEKLKRPALTTKKLKPEL